MRTILLGLVMGAALAAAEPPARLARAMSLLESASIEFWNKSGCVACHHHGLVSMAAATARAKNAGGTEEMRRRRVEIVTKFLEARRERLLQGVGIPGATDTMVYVLFGLVEDGYEGGAETDAGLRYLMDRQAADGSWPIGGMRPPLEHSSIANTALAMRAVQRLAPPAWREEAGARLRRAGVWMEAQRAGDTEDNAFRLLGLVWSNASAAAIAEARKTLLTAQREDGGWSQDAGRASDAYATGQALAALLTAGEKASATAVRRGAAFLTETQKDDGSWYVKSHVEKFQPYFESGFPHGHDQWISAAATAWAVKALALAGTD
jgi:hypothetical protein